MSSAGPKASAASVANSLEGTESPNHVFVGERTRPQQQAQGNQTHDEDEDKKAVPHGLSLPPFPMKPNSKPI